MQRNIISFPRYIIPWERNNISREHVEGTKYILIYFPSNIALLLSLYGLWIMGKYASGCYYILLGLRGMEYIATLVRPDIIG